MTIVIFLRCATCAHERIKVVEIDRHAGAIYYAVRCIGPNHDERMEIVEVHRAR